MIGSSGYFLPCDLTHFIMFSSSIVRPFALNDLNNLQYFIHLINFERLLL